MGTVKAKNIVWHPGVVNQADRETITGHRACTIWMTGLPASGKSTLAVALEKALWDRGVHAFVLDGDNVRHGLNKDLGFSPEDRNENIRRIGEVAKLFTTAGVINITAFISPYRADRDQARKLMTDGEFLKALIDDPAFAWLAPLTALIVRLDEAPADDVPRHYQAEIRRLQEGIWPRVQEQKQRIESSEGTTPLASRRAADHDVPGRAAGRLREAFHSGMLPEGIAE